jgi:hypothetical protein
MIGSDATDWSRWREGIQQYLAKHGYLPTPTAEDLEIPDDLVMDCWQAADTGPEKLRSVCHITDAFGGPAERGAVLLLLWHLTTDKLHPQLPETDETERRATVSRLFADTVLRMPVAEIDEPWRVRTSGNE